MNATDLFDDEAARTSQLAGVSDFCRLFKDHGWFTVPGAHVLVDGQFGSTGKGLLAGLITLACGDRIDGVTTNAGPNSGHTAYFLGHKIVCRQTPMSSAFLVRSGIPHWCYLNGGAVIDPDTLRREIHELLRVDGEFPKAQLFVHPHAAVIKPDHMGQNMRIASTGKGVGPALAAKIDRREDAVFVNSVDDRLLSFARGLPARELLRARLFVEVAQGFSLGINQGFYPYTTARECTVSQALADAGLPPQSLRKTAMSLRLYPIRVGNTAEGTSGPCYPDQEELTWDDLGVTPEVTTVTGRVRRVFTWSWRQFREAVRVNQPDALFVNFCNYARDEKRLAAHLELIWKEAEALRDGRPLDFLLTGHGPECTDVQIWRTS